MLILRYLESCRSFLLRPGQRLRPASARHIHPSSVTQTLTTLIVGQQYAVTVDYIVTDAGLTVNCAMVGSGSSGVSISSLLYQKALVAGQDTTTWQTYMGSFNAIATTMQL